MQLPVVSHIRQAVAGIAGCNVELQVAVDWLDSSAGDHTVVHYPSTNSSSQRKRVARIIEISPNIKRAGVVKGSRGIQVKNCRGGIALQINRACVVDLAGCGRFPIKTIFKGAAAGDIDRSGMGETGSFDVHYPGVHVDGSLVGESRASNLGSPAILIDRTLVDDGVVAITQSKVRQVTAHGSIDGHAAGDGQRSAAIDIDLKGAIV